MTQGPSQPDETPDQKTQGPGQPGGSGPFDTWSQGTTPEPTSPPRGSFLPLEGTIPGFGSLSGSRHFDSGQSDSGQSDSGQSASEPPEEVIGVQGALQPGQVLFGRYLAEKLLGEGGMGTVWLVKHLELDTLRALKLIVSGIAFDPQAQARFKREARVMARLSHPHAVVVHDARMGRDAAFIEMEYIRGQSLNKAMTPGVPMPLDWIARILEQLCDVLEEAHNQKIVHRDLKPANLMLLDGRPPGREQLKVLDFGIAKILGGDADTGAGDVHTHTGSFLGSAPYTSPEQASGGDIDGRSDIYSVGIILYEMMTGNRPFIGPITRLIYDHLYSLPPPFSERNPENRIPPAVEAVVMRCLAKNPDERPQTALELLEEFRQALPDGFQIQGGHTLPGTERDRPGLRPEAQTGGTPSRFADNETANSRTQALTEDDQRVPYQYPNIPPVPTQGGFTYAKPGSARSGLENTDWGEPAVGTVALPTSRRKTRGLLLVLVTVLAGGGFGLYKFSTSPRLRPGSVLPQGYVAAEGAELVNGHPQILIRPRDGAKFILIQGGAFKLGNDGFDSTGSGDDEDQPAHPVVLTDFSLQETEVTNGEMEAYFIANQVDVANRPKRWAEAADKIKKAGNDSSAFPAVGITHELAEKYAKWVGGKLPTEAQWEYAARSQGKPIPYVGGVDAKPDLTNANVDSIGQHGMIPTSRPRESTKDRTEQGIYDMTGNVREWCRDVWAPYVSSTTPTLNPVVTEAPKNGPPEFVIRGGSFAVWKDLIRTTRPRRPATGDQITLGDLAEDQSARDLGFRVVIEWPQP